MSNWLAEHDYLLMGISMFGIGICWHWTENTTTGWRHMYGLLMEGRYYPADGRVIFAIAGRHC